jgi:hypothetical protein
MKRLLIALAIIAFFCVGGHAQLQRPQVLPQRMPYSYYQFTGYLQADSGLLLPHRVANFTPKRATLIYDTGAARIRFYLDGWKSIQDVAFTSSYRNLVDTPTNVTTQGNTFNGAYQLLQLDNAGKVYFANLPSTLMTYKGTWSAATNTPALADGTGVSGWMYQAIDSGVVDFGNGPITFYKNDYVGYNGSVWQWSPGNPGVRSVNGFQNIVNLTTANIPEGGSVLYWTAARSRAAQSVTATGLTYDNSTGVISLTPGYAIPSTTDLSNWNSAYSWGNWAAGSHYVGTTLIANNRSSASQTLTGVSIDGNAGTVTNGVYTTGGYADPAWITSLAYSKLTGAPSLSGYVPYTGASTNVNLGANSLTAAAGTFSQRITSNAIANDWGIVVNGSGTSGQSFGIVISAGTVSGDYPMLVRNQSLSKDFLSVNGIGNIGVSTVSQTPNTFSSSSTVLQINPASGNTYAILKTSDGTNHMHYVTGDSKHWIYGTGAIPLLVYTNSTLALTINSAQNFILNGFDPQSGNWYAASTYKYLSAGGFSLQYRNDYDAYLGSNMQISSGGTNIVKYSTAEGAGFLSFIGGRLIWNSISGSVTAGSTYTFTPKFDVAATGQTTFSYYAGSGNRITYFNSSGVLASMVIGSGLSFDGTTLTATGGSSGTITGSGTSGFIPLWNSASDIGNSVMSQSGTVITVAGSIVSTSVTVTAMPTMGANTKYFTMFDAVAGGELKYATVANVQSYLGLGPAAYLNANLSSFTNDAGFITNSTSSLVNYYTATNIQNFFSGASAITGYNYTNWNTAYSWGNHAGLYLPLSGGTLTGGLNGTTAYFTGSVTAATFFEIPSDIRKKEVVKRWTSADGMDAIAYYLKKDPAKTILYGFEAQQVMKVLPTAVATHEDSTMPDGITYSVGYTQVLVYKIALLEKRIESLENLIKK